MATLAGGAQGAAWGSFGGPWGAAIGFVVGAVVATVATAVAVDAISDAIDDADTKADTRTRDTAIADTCKDCKPPCHRTVIISASRYPGTTAHMLAAQAAGHPSNLTFEPAGAPIRRAAALSGIPTKPGLDRDEYPPATFAEGGAGSSVQYVPFSDNRGAGASMGRQLAGTPPGCRVTLTVGP